MGQVNWNNLYPNWNSSVQVKSETRKTFPCLITFFLHPKTDWADSTQPAVRTDGASNAVRAGSLNLAPCAFRFVQFCT